MPTEVLLCSRSGAAAILLLDRCCVCPVMQGLPGAWIVGAAVDDYDVRGETSSLQNSRRSDLASVTRSNDCQHFSTLWVVGFQTELT